MDVSVVIVNYNSGEYLAGCLESLGRQPVEGLEIEFLVVDSCSSMDQSGFLEGACARGARIIEMTRNLGYAGGCNRGLKETSGRFVFFLNADVLAVGNCLGPLVDYLGTHPDVGLIEPRTYLDPSRVFIIPEIHLLTRWELFLAGCARTSLGLSHRLSLRRLKRTLPYWQATEPIRIRTLSGAFLGSRRAVIEGVGGFDEGYPLFYEDTDLFKRVKEEGMRLVLFPQSEAIHLAHRSVATEWNRSMAKMRLGRERYIQKHMGFLTLLINRFWEHGITSLNRLHAQRAIRKMADLGSVMEPPKLKWGGPMKPFLLELALDPHFFLAAGHFGEGNGFVFSEETWASLLKGDYYLRALDLEGLKEYGCWKLKKVSSADVPIP